MNFYIAWILRKSAEYKTNYKLKETKFLPKRISKI